MNTQKCDKLTSTHTLWLGVCIEQIEEVVKGKMGTQKEQDYHPFHTTAVSPIICHMFLKIPSRGSQENAVYLITLQYFLHTSSHFIIHNGSLGIQHYITPYHIYPNTRQGLSLKKLQLKNNREFFFCWHNNPHHHHHHHPPPTRKKKDCCTNKKNIIILQMQFHDIVQ